MTPRPHDLDQHAQREMAYAAAEAMDEHEMYDFVYWQTVHKPEMFLTDLEAFRSKIAWPDGWDQAD